MGFQINEFEKQHLNLSEQAWGVVYEDIQNFYYDKSKSSLSGFLNRIFYNFYQFADATISLRRIEQKNRLEELFATIGDEETTKKHIELLLDQYTQALIAKAHAHAKDEGKKFRINKKNLEIIENSEDWRYYNDSIGQYFKAVIEEFATKKMAEREAIFFSETIETINYAIQAQKKLKISQFPTVTSSLQGIHGRKYLVSPYKILTDKVSMYNYLICYAEEIDADGNISEKLPVSFRISKISKIDIMKSISGFISTTEKSKFDEEIHKRTPQFMAGEVVDVKVAFTPNGLEDLKRVVHLRPTKYEKINETTYVFHCTELQASVYFFKFGENAMILEPIALRKKFLKKYQAAFESYFKPY